MWKKVVLHSYRYYPEICPEGHSKSTLKKKADVAVEIRTVYFLNTSEKGNRFSHVAQWNIRGITKCSPTSTPSSVVIIPAYNEHQHRASPSQTIQFNFSDHISLTLYISYCATGSAQSVQRLATGCAIQGSNPGGGEIFRTRPDRPWGPPSLLYNGYGVYHEGKAAEAWC